MSAPSIRMDGSLRLRSLEAAADCGAFIELEAEREQEHGEGEAANP